MRTPLSGLLGAYFFTGGHQPRHFLLGHLNGLATPFGEAYGRGL